MKLAVFYIIALLVCTQVRAQQWDWAERFVFGRSTGQTIALDNGNNIYVAGTFVGTNILGTNVLVSSGGEDVFVAKFTPRGELRWMLKGGGTNNDSLIGIVATSNGTVYVVGQFDLPLNPTGVRTNVLVARIDDGVVTWTDQFNGEPNAGIADIALGPDDTPWVLGVSSRVFIRRYNPDGSTQATYWVGNSFFYPKGIAINRFGNPYIRGALEGTIDLGTTNVTASWGLEDFTAALSSTGGVQWVWVKRRYLTYDPIHDLACTPDGGVISVGFWNSGLPQGYLLITKHSDLGVQEWRIDRTGYRKSLYSGTALDVDARGYAHVVGDAYDVLRGSPHYRHGIGVWVFSPKGDLVSEEFITSGRASDADGGRAIAVDRSGNTVISGYIQGRARFGTNEFGGFSGSVDAFLARRATVVPELALTADEADLTIHWPRTATQFALQRAAALASDQWFDVTNAPVVTDDRWSWSADTPGSNSFYRLRQTNELINFPPEFIYWFEPSGPVRLFTNGFWTFFTTNGVVSNLTVLVWYKDWDYDAVGVAWYDDSGTVRLNQTQKMASYYTTFDDEEITVYVGILDEPTLTFPVGTNTIFAVASDGKSYTTNGFTFVVSNMDQSP